MDAVAEIRMDRPPANALNRELVELLLAALESTRMDGAHAIILTVAGPDVQRRPGCSGASGADRRQVEAFWSLFFSLNRQLAGSPVPVIAGDFRAMRRGWRGAHHAVRLADRRDGQFQDRSERGSGGPAVPEHHLLEPGVAGGSRAARRLATRGELLLMDAAAAIGLVDELVAPDDLLGTALERANELLALPPVAMNTTRLPAAKARLIEAMSSSG